METQVNAPKWRTKFEKSFPPGIASTTTDFPKTDMPDSNTKTSNINTWVVVGIVLAVAGTIAYAIWKEKQDEKIQKQGNQAQSNNPIPCDHDFNAPN